VAQLLMRRPDLADLPPAPAGIESAAAADVAGLASLLAAAFDEPWDGDRVRRDLLDDPTVKRTLIMRDGGAIVATASARVLPSDYPGAGYVHWVASDPTHRGRGLGFAATLAVLHEFLAEGLTEAVLETDDQRLSAITVYLGLGFVPQYRDESHQLRWSKIFTALNDERRRAGRKTQPTGASDEDTPTRASNGEQVGRA
jgi:mycothiol synthase